MAEMTKYIAIGRRKESVARVWLLPGTGNILVNAQPHDKYFIRETDRLIIKQPLQATNTLSKYDIRANIQGGGLAGQAGALRLGIARALILAEPNLKDLLRKNGFLTRDPRMKERKKYGQKGARKRFQWTKR
jgi:small subunit ribosomal protein S9